MTNNTVGVWLRDDGTVGKPDPNNLYRYCGNGPTNHIDPTGLYDEDIHFYMTYYLASAVGLADAKLVNTQKELRTRGGKPTTPAFVIAWFTQHVDDNRLTMPIPSHFLPDVKRIFNDDIFFWHFYSLELNVDTLKGRKELIEALQALGGPDRGKIKGKYFKELIPLPVTPNSTHVKELLKQTTRKVEGTDRMLPNSDAMFGMVLHTYEDSWSHAGFQMPIGHGAALYGGHGPDIPWVEPNRATGMAEQIYMRLEEYARAKYGVKKPAYSWDQIKREVSGLMESGKDFDSEQYRKGDKATYERDVQSRIKAWKQAIQKRFGSEMVYKFNKEEDATKDEWFGVFKRSISDIKPREAPFAPTITDIKVFKALLREAFEELDKRRAKILPPNEREWLDLLRNVYEQMRKVE